MRTEILPYEPSAVARAAALIEAGRLVAFPTETVYGLGARADQSSAVAGIFRAKGRAATNPLIVHVESVVEARALAKSFPPDAERLAAAFWPGPLTLVVHRRNDAVADEVAAYGPTVAIRVPAAPVARALLAACRLPIAAPSANRSTTISPTTAAHVVKTLGGRIDLVLDGGPCRHGIESTIVDVTRGPAVLLRPGAISLDALRRHVDLVDPGAVTVTEGERAPSPGTSARHYAPAASLSIVPPDAVAAEVLRLRGEGVRAGAIELSPGSGLEPPAVVLPPSPDGFAAALYAALHRLEDAGCSAIVVAAPPDESAWAAVRDRLRRAAVPAEADA
ncbi:L-threonylcarbamoyladenylate synthase [Polyangium aurulentum]|uniref:L-threonylcarbamoyladenylate synthase n=1 Tax=Polyangium aurulentum TaxID=2567896 RepID=UPI0010AE0535|nr:L-threonylcarbamoyladenylate synthase [Polyangium aurulentum]UQA59598.1 threonylcarbamoyl-AMP synthase [Polyangium aurulentum]